MFVAQQSAPRPLPVALLLRVLAFLLSAARSSQGDKNQKDMAISLEEMSKLYFLAKIFLLFQTVSGVFFVVVW